MQGLLTGSVHGILIDLLRLAVLAALTYVGPRAVRWLDAHTSLQQRDLLEAAAHSAVLWAEAFAGATGEAKFTAAVGKVSGWLGRYGFTLAEIQAVVQAAFASAKTAGLLGGNAAPPAKGA